MFIDGSNIGGDIPVVADVIRPNGATDTGALRVAKPYRMLYSNRTVGPTAAIDSGSLDLTGIESVMVVLFNGNTTLTRSPVLNFQDAAAATMFAITPSAITAASRGSYALGAGVTGTGITAAYAYVTPSKLQVTVAAPASGTGNSTIDIYGR